jgi:FkbM family methyltransferase
LDRSLLPDHWFESLTIYDVGLHTGQDTDFYLKKGFRVVAVEANPQLCEQARQRFSEFIDAGRLHIVNVGVGQAAGKMEFYINEERTEWSSFFRQISARDGSEPRVIEVDVVTMESILQTYGPAYYIKIDIEGNDGFALESILSSDFEVPYVSIENGSALLKLFRDSPYDAFQYVQQNNVHELSRANPALEGRDVEHVFEFGASGKFGEELEGEWLDYDEVYNLVSAVWSVETGKKNPSWDDASGGWFDLHARHKEYNRALLTLVEG